MYGKKMYKRGGKTGEISNEKEKKSDRAKKEYLRKEKRKLDSYTPQTQRKPQGPPTPVAGNRMGGKLEGSAKNFAAIAERAKKAKKPR